MSEQPFTFYVKDPEQRSGNSKLELSYWVYHVHATTTLSHYAQKKMEVVRRYSDFEWLRAQLCEEYVWCIVPPIPQKTVTGTLEKFVGGVHDPAQLQYRMRALRKFLVRVGAHPHLYNSTLLMEFLQMDSTEWERRMKAPKKAENRSLVGALSDAGSALAKSWGTSAGQGAGSGADAYTKALSEPKTSPQVWEETKGYVSQLETSVQLLKDRLEALVKRRKETASSLHEFGKAFSRVGEVEASMEQQMNQGGDGSLSNALVAVGQHSESLSKVYVEHADSETKQVVETLIYYLGMSAALRDTLKRLLGLMNERDKMIARVNECQANCDKLMKTGTPDKVAQAQQDLQNYTERRNAMEKHVINFEILFKEELRRFHREKQFDMKSMLKSFVELQLDYASKMKRNWEQLLPTVEKVKM